MAEQSALDEAMERLRSAIVAAGGSEIVHAAQLRTAGRAVLAAYDATAGETGVVPMADPDAAIEAIEALPVHTLFKLGWMTSADNVQASLYLRTRAGVRYVGPPRDGDRPISSIVPRRFSDDQPQGLQIVHPVAAGGATPDPAQRHERISGASVYCSCGNGWPCLEGTTPR